MQIDDLKAEIGWSGLFTRREEPGAWPNGTRVIKIAGSDGDTHRTGAEGTVLGSFLSKNGRGMAYFVEWDAQPQTATLVLGWKLGAADTR